jgi:hypothetical protein
VRLLRCARRVSARVTKWRRVSSRAPHLAFPGSKYPSIRQWLR